MQLDRGNQQVTTSAPTVSELYLQYIRGVGRILWVLGHQVQVMRSRVLKGKHTHTLTFSISHTLFNLMKDQDFLRPHQGAAQPMWRLLCVVITDHSRHGGEKKRGDGGNWKSHQELSEDKKKRKKSIFHFSPLFGLIFPARPFTTGGRQGKVVCSEKESGKGQKTEMTHIPKKSEHLTSENTPDTMTENIWATLSPLCKKTPLWFAFSIPCLWFLSTCVYLL